MAQEADRVYGPNDPPLTIGEAAQARKKRGQAIERLKKSRKELRRHRLSPEKRRKSREQIDRRIIELGDERLFLGDWLRAKSYEKRPRSA
jgi:hypothetical protein